MTPSVQAILATLGSFGNHFPNSSFHLIFINAVETKNVAGPADELERSSKFPRLYMDGWRDGLDRVWRDGVTVLPRPAKKIATAKNNRPVPALEKKNTAPSRPVEKKKKATPSRLGKKQQPPRPASEKKKRPSRLGKKKNAPSRLENKTKPPRPAMNSKIHRPEGGNWKQIPPPVSFSLFLVAHLYRIVV